MLLVQKTEVIQKKHLRPTTKNYAALETRYSQYEIAYFLDAVDPIFVDQFTEESINAYNAFKSIVS